jgi:hypothetical protein
MRAFLISSLVALSAVAPAAAETITVVLDQARVMRISEPAATIIIGNPSIADATIQDASTLVITGRSYGITNLLILDENGDAIADTQLRVEGPSIDRLTVYRGTSRFSYSCGGLCEPALVPGDNATFFGEISGQSGTRNSVAAGQAATEPAVLPE